MPDNYFDYLYYSGELDLSTGTTLRFRVDKAEEEPDPVIFFGKVVCIANPPLDEPPLPGMVWAVQVESVDYILTRASHWMWGEEHLFIDDVEYFIGDSIEAEGEVTVHYDLQGNAYRELEISTIRKIEEEEDYFPENKLWSVYDEVSNMGFGSGYFWRTYLHYVKGEKELEGKNWKQFYCAEKEDKSDECPCFLMLQEGQRVYKDSMANLIFDFGAEKGDIIWRQFNDTWSSYSEGIHVDSVYYKSFIDGKPARKCLDVSLRYYTDSRDKDTVEEAYFPYASDTWVEGFGSLRMGGLNPREFMAAGGISHLLCVHQNGEQEYQHHNFKTCYVPAPVEGSFAGRIVKIAKPQPRQSPEEGEVYALAVDTDVYFLRTYNCFFWSDNPSGYPCSNQIENLAQGDSVGIRGYLALRQEQNGKYYRHLLVEEIKRFSDTTHVNVVSVDKLNRGVCRLFPNPTKNKIIIKSTAGNIQQVEILDIGGRLLHTATVANAETFTYNVSSLSKGLYMARVKTSCGVETLKFVVK